MDGNKYLGSLALSVHMIIWRANSTGLPLARCHGDETQHPRLQTYTTCKHFVIVTYVANSTSGMFEQVLEEASGGMRLGGCTGNRTSAVW